MRIFWPREEKQSIPFPGLSVVDPGFRRLGLARKSKVFKLTLFCYLRSFTLFSLSKGLFDCSRILLQLDGDPPCAYSAKYVKSAHPQNPHIFNRQGTARCRRYTRVREGVAGVSGIGVGNYSYLTESINPPVNLDIPRGHSGLNFTCVVSSDGHRVHTANLLSQHVMNQ